MALQIGTVSVHARGFGFLEWTDGTQSRSAFIPAPELRGFLHLDVAKAEVSRDKKGLAAKNLTLLERSRTQLFGVVTHDKKGALELTPDPEVANRPWRICGSDLDELVPDRHVVADIGDGGVHVRSEVPDDEVPLYRIRDRYLIPHHFSDAVLADAEAQKSKRTTGWRDLRDVTTITIDAPHSRDLDDALSVHPAGPDGALRLLVHIADVDSVVGEGTEVDAEARQRGTSVYLAGAVTPMLPRVLSEDRLSLVPGQDRRALTAELRLDAEGDVTSIDLYPSTIRSNRRLSYEEVDTFLSGTEPDLPDDILEALSWLRTASSRLAAVRVARGGVQFDRVEAHIELDEDLEPVEILAREQTPAHLLIERLMVATNEAVASWLADRGLPAVFRVHPAPDAERVDELEASLERMGYSPGLASPLTPRGLSALQTQLHDAGLQPVLQEILAQVLDRARYTVHPGEHFGLGSGGYLHFTSPIRRYADLMVHRLVKAYLTGDRDHMPRDPAIEEVAVHLNDCAARSAKAEAMRRRMLTARWALQRMGETFDGHVVAVKPFGLVVQLRGTGVTAVVPTDSLDGSWSHEGHQLVSADATWAIGDGLQVSIDKVNEERGRIDLAIVVARDDTPRRRRGKASPKRARDAAQPAA